VEADVHAAFEMLIVAALVFSSVVFAAWRLAPARLKLRVLDTFKPDTRRLWGRWIARLRKDVAVELMHGCSTCGHGSSHVRKHKAG
jgi:hypothetical protein